MNDKSKDHVLISYSHRDDISKALAFFDEKGLNYIFDSEISIGQNWQTKFRRYLSNEHCKGVVVFMSEHSICSPAVHFELERCKAQNKKYFPIIIGSNSLTELFDNTLAKIDDEDQRFIIESIEDMFSNETVFINEVELLNVNNLPQIRNTFSSWGISFDAQGSKMSSTYSSNDNDEYKRLYQQQMLFMDFDKKVLHDIINQKENKRIAILDIGCNNGNLIIKRLEGITDREFVIVGVDINQTAVDQANKNHSDKNFHGYCMNCLDPDFLSDMQKIMRDLNVEGFDITVCSMVLLHVDNAHLCLKNIRKMMVSGGHLYIRDMDDGLALSYPDKENLVAKFNEFSKNLSFTGYRTMGREIYRLLIRNGFSDVKIIPQELDTVSRSAEYLDVLFNVNFHFIITGLKERHEANPNNTVYYNDYMWGLDAFERLEDLFHEPGYYYRMGTIVYLARK